MNRRRASSSFSTPEPKREKISPHIIVDGLHDLIVDDLDDLIDDGPLSPLTPLEESSDEEPQVPPGSKWCRRAEYGWRLPGEDEDDLHGVEWIKKVPPIMASLPNNLAVVVNRINNNIIKNLKDTNLLPSFLANGRAFYDNLFMSAMINEVNAEKGEEGNAKKLQETIENDNMRKEQVLGMLRKMVETNKTPDDTYKMAAVALEESKKISTQLKDAKRTGEKCRKNAVWIGVMRESEEQVKTWLGKGMVETKEQAQTGIRSGAFEENGYIRVDRLMNRICAPSGELQQRSVILWTKESADDKVKTWDKVFGGVVYDLDKLDNKFSIDNAAVKEEMMAMQNRLETGSSNPIPRGRIKQGGVMVKATGPQAVFSKPYDAEIRVPVIKSENPTERTLKKVEAAKQLRVAMKAATPLIQARSHQFLAGFLPPLAEKQWALSEQFLSLRNVLGYPNLSSFGTFAYSASSHVDKDDSASSGSVMKRPPILQRHESNFVYTSHALVIELADQGHWFWNASDDAHGSTLNDLALRHPETCRPATIREDNTAQWTRVLVMPRRVVAANLRKETDSTSS